MTVFINAGSHIGTDEAGWTNTVETARADAEQWLDSMRAEGIIDVELLDSCTESDGRWVFTFRHRITKTEVKLETHGIDRLSVYQQKHLFAPRVYWNGSSSATPEVEDFAAPGFRAVKTFEADPTEGLDR